LLESAERLINELSERARLDTLRKAEEEVRKHEAGVRHALVELRRLRDQEGILDPTAVATSTSQLLFQALSERIRLQNDLSSMSQSLNRDSPSMSVLRAQIEAVDSQIANLRSQLTSTAAASRTVASFLVRFEELEIQRIFAERLYTMSQSALERARLKAEQKQIYLVVFQPPAMPQEAKYPERITYGLIMPFVFLIFWGVFALIAATVEDHQF
jgi:capsular polysaccharide transport system permease protein